jgi:hypothetical protein
MSARFHVPCAEFARIVHMGRRKPTNLVVLIAMAVCLALSAAPALAQDDPSEAQYEAPVPEAADEQATESAAESDESGLEAPIAFLPFTGYDLIIVGGTALVLTGVGFALRRAAAPRGPFA